MLTLVEGPAGSGKSQLVEGMLAAGEIDVQADLTAIWVGLRGVRRGPDGRYPKRLDGDPTITSGLAAYMRATVVRQGLRQGLRVAVTSGTPATAVKWAEVARENQSLFTVLTVDPGEDVVRQRLMEVGEDQLAEECERAVRRWYRPERTESFPRIGGLRR